MGIVMVASFRRFIIVLCALAGAAVVFSNPRPVHAQEAYTLGVFPFLPPLRLEQLYGPFGGVISGAIGRPVEFRTKATFEKFTVEIENQTYDVAYMQPFDYVLTGSKNNYQALTRFDEKLTAIIVVPEDSAIQNIKNLTGKTLAMPPVASAVSRLAVAEFQQMKMLDDRDLQMTHHRTHSGCLQAVLIGSADACITNIVPFKAFLATSKQSFRTVYETAAIPMSTFAVHTRLPKADREKIRTAFISLKDTPQGQKLLAASGRKSGMIAADDKDYDVVRKMMQATAKAQ